VPLLNHRNAAGVPPAAHTSTPVPEPERSPFGIRYGGGTRNGSLPLAATASPGRRSGPC
jgi:hypothetical protein